MGRKKTAKKRKVEEGADAEDDDNDDLFATDEQELVGDSHNHQVVLPANALSNDNATDKQLVDANVAPTLQNKAPSSYSVKTHSAEVFDTDIYVSSGSEEDEDDNDDDIDILLLGSRMGIMRRGISMLVQQQNRQWVRPQDKVTGNDDDGNATTMDAQIVSEEQRLLDELANLDPAQRAARLLQEKQRKLEQAKELARRLESEENAGREPSLFSKRTAFDIRFDQLEDKPWERGAGDVTDFFNYGLTEEEWLEYGQQQLAIRQELMDAHWEKRAIDPNIVPVVPKKAALVSSQEVSTMATDGDEQGGQQEQGPIVSNEVKQEISTSVAIVSDLSEEEKQKYYNIDVGFLGAWGAGNASD